MNKPEPLTDAQVENRREALAEKLVDAILTWKSGHVVEGLAQQYRAASPADPAARTPSQPDRPVDSYPFAEVCPGCGRSDEHAAPCTVRVRLPGHATPSQPDLRGLITIIRREELVNRLAIHLHQKGVGCDGHVGDDRAVADVVHRDDAYDIYDFIASQPSPADLAAARLRDLQTYISGEADNGRVERRIANAVINKAESAARLLHAVGTPR